MEEPSLLDYLKSKLSLRRTLSSDADVEPQEDRSESKPSLSTNTRKGSFIRNFPWRSLLALILAIFAQRLLEPVDSNPKLGVFFYVSSGLLLVYALLKKEWTIPEYPEQANGTLNLSVRKIPLFFFIPLLFLSFLAFSGNEFTGLNLVLWLSVIIAGLAAFWIPQKTWNWETIKHKVVTFARNPVLALKLTPWKVLVLLVFCMAAFFHLSQINTVPLEMTSDHTEKLLDVNDVLNGNYSIFFPRNAGREPIQFYLSAALIRLFGTGLTFFTLKIGMGLAFLGSLYYVYQLGKEVGGRWTGLLTMLFIGFAAWTNIIARVGMRLVLTPVFVAPMLFYLFRGMRRMNRNDLLLSGVFLGLGMLGYSAFRIVPLVVIVALIVYLVRQNFDQASRSLVWGFGLLALFALVFALPLVRVAIQEPNIIGMRMISRMTGVEKAIPGSVIAVFFNNFWNAATMPFWRDGSTWVISVTNRPALDVISAVFYFFGLVLMIYRWIRTRTWQDLVLMISIPILMLPSILSLAFPDENPSLSRAGGAVIPILLITAIGFETLLSSLWKQSRKVLGKILVVVLAGILVVVSARQNYDLVFNQYADQYNNATWNSAQMGAVARDFIDSFGNPETVWVVGVPHWVDTRLVAMNAGYLTRDYAIWPQDLELTLSETRAKLFFVKFDDQIGMGRLQELYPNGFVAFHESDVEGREFYTYIVPPVIN